jgi:hypothetical protein
MHRLSIYFAYSADLDSTFCQVLYLLIGIYTIGDSYVDDAGYLTLIPVPDPDIFPSRIPDPTKKRRKKITFFIRPIRRWPYIHKILNY